MHEISVARNILNIVGERVPEEDLRSVRRINIRVGIGSGVLPSSLEFSFRAIASQTPLASASLTIEHVPFTIHCRTCGLLSTVDPFVTLCPKCFGVSTDIRSGMELQVVSIELAEHHEHSHG